MSPYPTPAESGDGDVIAVGYRSVITLRSRYDGMGVNYDWHVHVTRLSDGGEAVRIFAWRWRARRFVRSSRRLGNAFREAASLSADQREEYLLDWSDTERSLDA